jgi:flagellar hook-basal body complex protein FliE
MIKGITDLATVSPVAPIAAGAKTDKAASFQSMLQSAIERVESSRTAASDAVEKFVSGQDQDLHTTILATQRASLDFELLLQVRNKVVQSYQEIMRMQL